MIEVQVNPEIYDEVKMYASYHSDITHVCAFRDELIDLIKNYGIEIEKDEESEQKRPVLTIQGKNVMKLEDAPAEMLHFVGVRSEFDPTIALRNMNYVHKLISSNLVQLDSKFKELYSPMKYRSKINELVCANVKFYGKGKLTDFIDGDLTIQSMKFNECNEKSISYKQLSLTVKEPIVDEGKIWTIKCETYNERIKRAVLLKFYSKSNLLRSIAFKGNKIGISTTKVLQDKEYNYVINDPIILPNPNFTMDEDIMLTPKTRAIPVDLWRNALFEFMYRYDAN